MTGHRKPTLRKRIAKRLSRPNRLTDLTVEAENEIPGARCPACSTGRSEFPCTCPRDCGAPECTGGRVW
jgi:hypothetical protein